MRLRFQFKRYRKNYNRICRQRKTCGFDKLTILNEVEEKLSAVRLTSTSLSTSRRLSEFSRGDFLAAAGGESGSD